MAGRSVGPTIAKAKVIADGDLPIWGFHSRWDTAVPATSTTNYVNWINGYKPGLARLTLFDDSTHICWKWSFKPTYVESDSVSVYEWMLMHKRELPRKKLMNEKIIKKPSVMPGFFLSRVVITFSSNKYHHCNSSG